MGTPSNYLYCICGDADQTLKAWDPKEFGKKHGKDGLQPLIKCNTMRETILGFEINPKPADDNVDEFLLFGKRKFGYCTITKDKKGLKSKIKAVSVVSLKKDGEKSFACGQFLDNGNYLVGSSSGAIYVGNQGTALAVLESAHDNAVGAMCMAADKLLTAGKDRKFKTWNIGECRMVLVDWRKAGKKRLKLLVAIWCYNHVQLHIMIRVALYSVVQRRIKLYSLK